MIAVWKMRRPRRRGITILEVLIAIAVVSIGLFGVMAVLPLAVQRANRASVYDYAAVAGSNAVDEFQIRGMGKLENWRTAGNGTFANRPLGAYCIDPLFVATGNVAAGGADPTRFPYGKNAGIVMPRITLQNGSGGGILDGRAADLIFTLRDDLVFNAPDPSNTSLPQVPIQEYIIDGGVAQKRAINGRTTWFATVSRANAGSDMWNLAIVLCHNRDFTMKLSDDNANPLLEDQRKQNEQVSNVAVAADFYGGGYHGGDMRITGTTPESVGVRTGDWVMLSGVGPTGFTYHRWYRVVAADNESLSAGTAIPGVWTRDITLQGSDWNVYLMGTPQVTFVRNVVAVYEKTIRLDNQAVISVWDN